MNTYTLVGYFSDTEQRFCETVQADSVEEAQDLSIAANGGVVICAVFAGDLHGAMTDGLPGAIEGEDNGFIEDAAHKKLCVV